MAKIYEFSGKKNRIKANTLLILINVICFVIFSAVIFLKIFDLDYIAIKPSNILSGNFLWTLLTSMFMHAGFFHIFANMFSLLFIGGLVERILGKKRYVWFYLFSGLFSGLFFVLISFLFKIDLDTYAVGASGALFGLVGLLMVVTPNLPVYIMFIPIPVKIKYAAPGILIILWLISAIGNIPIGNTAHFGGLIAGLIYGFYLKTRYRNKTKYISRFFS
jgi:membrane associated rhomboid family serine protease